MFAAGHKCVYGSVLSPPRLQQIREAIMDWMDNTNLATDVLFLDYLPLLANQLDLKVKPGDEDCIEVGMDVLYASCK